MSATPRPQGRRALLRRDRLIPYHGFRICVRERRPITSAVWAFYVQVDYFRVARNPLEAPRVNASRGRAVMLLTAAQAVKITSPVPTRHDVQSRRRPD